MRQLRIAAVEWGRRIFAAAVETAAEGDCGRHETAFRRLGTTEERVAYLGEVARVRDARVAVFVHLVWATWDRLPLLSADITPAVYRAIGAKCQELKAEVIAIGGVEDYVHLLVRLPATLTVADLAKHVKGVSAHLVNAQLRADRTFRWQGSYSAFSVDPDHLDRVITYIAHQHEHHRTGTLYTPWEPAIEPHTKHDRSPP